MDRRCLPLALTAALALSACGNATSAPDVEEKVSVVASFYPLEYAVARVGGDRVEVTNLTRPGVEAHDAELSAKDVTIVSKADLAVYEKNLQPAVDSAITSQGVQNTLDVAEAADLSLTFSRGLGAHEHDTPSGAAATPEDHGDEDHEDEGHQGHNHESEEGTVDPHFWLDPIRYGQVAQAIAAKLSKIDPSHATAYDENAAAFVQDLQKLDGEFRSGLKTCASRDLVTSHAAFGYLADRYDLNQVSISGLSPQDEPDPGTMAAISDFTKKNGVRTIYTETLANPAVAETLAAETGADHAVLDPIEGLNEAADGGDYLELMRSNLQTLKRGQGCS
ncbi:metal ABC transporter substrate-binding protein [Gephyromycinifex aptenodytis]|uniref:metal ABC transporter substrate-binding protein n=1 Tax=Gephyromycinifex aptenodytis TaxID=2716227 RepID=UPI00144634A9|nr:metal ABC transporter substrate-binding protein [Gephyromycinifex aptenodytis]